MCTASSKLLVLHLHTRAHHLQAPPISTKGHLQLVLKPQGQVSSSFAGLRQQCMSNGWHRFILESQHNRVMSLDSTPVKVPPSATAVSRLVVCLLGHGFPKSTFPLKLSKTHIIASVFIRFFDMSMKILMVHSISLYKRDLSQLFFQKILNFKKCPLNS